jgi:hypothetical protein
MEFIMSSIFSWMVLMAVSFLTSNISWTALTVELISLGWP